MSDVTCSIGPGVTALLGLLAAYELGVSRLGSGGEDEEEVPPPGPMAVAG